MRKKKTEVILNNCQQKALEILNGPENVFLTGVAGSGKSFLVRHYLSNLNPKTFPVLASTGAAAILVGGRTFHSFFGLGIMEGGVEATVDRALEERRVIRRLKKVEGVVIDEISMISGDVLRCAEAISRLARETPTPWGGLKVVVVGDFAQLPPVSHGGRKDWAFQDPLWDESHFQPAVLRTVVRNQDPEFVEILNFIRNGEVNEQVEEFLNQHACEEFEDSVGTRLFPHRRTTESFNLKRLQEIDNPVCSFPTEYAGTQRQIAVLKKNAPIPEELLLKQNALIMLRQNDPRGRWVNGSLGHIEELDDEHLQIRLLNGRIIEIGKATFSLMDADGRVSAAAVNFPVNLAYASTIHKAQGATLDKAFVDLRRLWEPGQAYVALSRVPLAENLQILGWDPSSIRTDPAVRNFHEHLLSQY